REVLAETVRLLQSTALPSATRVLNMSCQDLINKDVFDELYEMAQHSTMFLDEVGALAPELQNRLLFLLQGSEFRRSAVLALTPPPYASIKKISHCSPVILFTVS